MRESMFILLELLSMKKTKSVPFILIVIGLEIFKPIHIERNKRTDSEKNTKVVVEQPFDKKAWVQLMNLISHLNRSQE